MKWSKRQHLLCPSSTPSRTLRSSIHLKSDWRREIVCPGRCSPLSSLSQHSIPWDQLTGQPTGQDPETQTHAAASHRSVSIRVTISVAGSSVSVRSPRWSRSFQAPVAPDSEHPRRDGTPLRREYPMFWRCNVARTVKRHHHQRFHASSSCEIPPSQELQRFSMQDFMQHRTPDMPFADEHMHDIYSGSCLLYQQALYMRSVPPSAPL